MNEQNLAPDFIDRTIDSLGSVLGAFGVDHLLFVVLAAVPALIWLWIFLKHQRENWFLVALTFFAGSLAVVPIFVFQYEIARIDDMFSVAVSSSIVTIVLSSLWIGFYEETAKHWIVKKTDRQFFTSIDDAIQFSIVAALGFAFLENILYFRSIWHNEFIDNFWFYYVFRSAGSMLLHVIASGVFGYFYGVATFAKPILKERLHTGKKFPLIGWLHGVFHFRRSAIFAEEKILEGLLAAAGLHALFDFLMAFSQHASDTGNESLAKLSLSLAIPFLVGGYFLLTWLLDRKENHKTLGHVAEREED